MPDSNIIEKAKQRAIDALNKNIGKMSDEAYAIVLKAIEETFDLEAGRIVTDRNFVKQLNRFTDEIINLIQAEPSFTGPITQFVKRLTPVSDAIGKFQKSTNGIKVPAFETAKKIVIDEILNQLLDNGLNQNFAQPIRDLIYQNATSGLSLKDARAQLRETATGKLRSYIEQTSIQAVESYSGMINVKIIEQFDMNAILMTGSLIDNSSPQCRYVLEELDGIITRENWPRIAAIGKKFKGWIDGTTFDNVAISKLHHGCRHNFYAYKLKKEAA